MLQTRKGIGMNQQIIDQMAELRQKHDMFYRDVQASLKNLIDLFTPEDRAKLTDVFFGEYVIHFAPSGAMLLFKYKQGFSCEVMDLKDTDKYALIRQIEYIFNNPEGI